MSNAVGPKGVDGFSAWFELRCWINGVRRRLLRLDPRDAEVRRLMRELCNLEHDLYMWSPCEDFDAVEFTRKLRSIERRLRLLEERIIPDARVL